MRADWKLPKNMTKIRRRIRELADEKTLKAAQDSIKWNIPMLYKWWTPNSDEFDILVFGYIVFSLAKQYPKQRNMRGIADELVEKYRCKNCHRFPPDHLEGKCLFEATTYERP